MAKIAFIGGTGPEGLGLAMRFAKSGNDVYIGSSSEERAQEAIAKIKEARPAGSVFGGLNAEGVEKADIIFLTVPYDAHHDTLEKLSEGIGDKLLVDVVVPLVFDRDEPKAIAVEEGAAAQEARGAGERVGAGGGRGRAGHRPLPGDVDGDAPTAEPHL